MHSALDRRDVSRQIYRMLIPMILENILTTSASLITSAMVGRLSALEISAQGVGGRITNTYLSRDGATSAAARWSRPLPPPFRWDF